MSPRLLKPVRWSPPKAPGRTGPYAPNTALAGVERWPVPGVGPEDVAVDAEGRVYTGTNDGNILRLSDSGRRIERVARTGGRPLGIEIDADGTLVVCDAHRGLLRVDPANGSVTTLVDRVDGVPLIFTNNCDIASDGTIYFTDSSTRFTFEEFTGDLLEHGSLGRLLRRSPDGGVDVLLDGLDFANGVALADDDSFVLVAETGGYRVTKYWLAGPRKGAAEVVIDNLPGFPDNMSTGSGGVFWIAIISERNALVDRLLDLPGFLRQAVWSMPAALQPAASRIMFVLGIDADGAVVHNLQGPGDDYHEITGVREHDGWLYFGSLAEDAVARVRWPS
jgi:sugar lactone lactonase YvrE